MYASQTNDSTYGKGNEYVWCYESSTTNTEELVNNLMSITEIEGLTDIECAKIVRHRPITYIYIKSDGKEYALPFSTGTGALWVPNTLFNLEFEFEEGRLYTAEEMYESIIEQYFALLDEIIALYEKDAVYNGVKLESANIPIIQEKYKKPDGEIMATPGEMAEKLQDVGLLKGTGDGLQIHNDMTRAEGITMLLRMIGEEEKAENSVLKNNVFEDVDSSHWASKNIAYAYDKGFVKGTTETTFSPEEKMSAPQFMVMLLRAMGYDRVEGETLSLENVNEIARKVGFETNFFDVQQLKRGHMVAIASRALNVVGSDGKTIAEKLQQNGMITSDQYEMITSPDFYTVPFEE